MARRDRRRGGAHSASRRSGGPATPPPEASGDAGATDPAGGPPGPGARPGRNRPRILRSPRRTRRHLRRTPGGPADAVTPPTPVAAPHLGGGGSPNASDLLAVDSATVASGATPTGRGARAGPTNRQGRSLPSGWPPVPSGEEKGQADLVRPGPAGRGGDRGPGAGGGRGRLRVPAVPVQSGDQGDGEAPEGGPPRSPLQRAAHRVRQPRPRAQPTRSPTTATRRRRADNGATWSRSSTSFRPPER